MIIIIIAKMPNTRNTSLPTVKVRKTFDEYTHPQIGVHTADYHGNYLQTTARNNTLPALNT